MYSGFFLSAENKEYSFQGRWLRADRRFSPGSSTSKTDHHNITEILLKVAINTLKTLTLGMKDYAILVIFLFQIMIYILVTTLLKSHISLAPLYWYVAAWEMIFCTMLHLFDDLWLDKIIPKNNDRRQSHIWKSRE